MSAFDPKRSFPKLIDFQHSPRMRPRHGTGKVEADQIPEQLQIDAALTNRLWNLVHRFCGGAWGELPSRWTVSFEEVVAEAKRRGLETFISSRPVSEGFWLLETDTGYVVFYTERGVRTDHEEFGDLEPAFRHWLRQTLRSHLLPIDAHP